MPLLEIKSILTTALEGAIALSILGLVFWYLGERDTKLSEVLRDIAKSISANTKATNATTEVLRSLVTDLNEVKAQVMPNKQKRSAN